VPLAFKNHTENWEDGSLRIVSLVVGYLSFLFSLFWISFSLGIGRIILVASGRGLRFDGERDCLFRWVTWTITAAAALRSPI